MEFELDILAQQALLNSYTLITLAYPTTNESSLPAIAATLNRGLESLAKSFPWVAGQVVNKGASATSSGMYKIVPLEANPRLVVKDLRDDPTTPSFASLTERKFPYAAPVMDEGILSPRRTLPLDPNEPKTRPVLLVQATFIQGGLLLTVATHHMAMDMQGQGHIMRLLSKACQNKPFTADELAVGNMARGNIIPYLDAMDKTAFEHQIAQRSVVAPSEGSVDSHANDGVGEDDVGDGDVGDDDVAAVAPKSGVWAYFLFDASSLAALKQHATKSVSSGFISTDDALSALVWQSILRARLPRLAPTTTTKARTTLARAINVRSALGIAETYPGVVINVAYSSFATVQQLVEGHENGEKPPLGAVASKLRSELMDRDRLAYMTRGLATLLHRARDKQTVSVAARLDIASTDLSLSSWGKIHCHDLTFQLGLGYPVAVRRPRMDPFEGLIYVMPKTVDGEVAMAICLREEDMVRLRGDTEFARYGRFIG